MTTTIERLQVVDSHTGGAPTRVVMAGGPALGDGTLAARRERMQREFDRYRTALVGEPRGAAGMVGALLCEPLDPSCVAAVVFFDRHGYPTMCGHGTIGLLVTLAYLGRITLGEHRLETPAGIIQARLESPHSVSLRNVHAYRHARAVGVTVAGFGEVSGDIAWGGNWFFNVGTHGLDLSADNIGELTQFARQTRAALAAGGHSGPRGAPIEHIQLLGASSTPGIDARNFVLDPGGDYDRSPCGTGTSAYLACRHADGLLAPGQPWRQESITGSVFEASLEVSDGRVFPRIAGQAYVTATATVLIDPHDALGWGQRAPTASPAA